MRCHKCSLKFNQHLYDKSTSGRWQIFYCPRCNQLYAQGRVPEKVKEDKAIIILNDKETEEIFYKTTIQQSKIRKLKWEQDNNKWIAKMPIGVILLEDRDGPILVNRPYFLKEYKLKSNNISDAKTELEQQYLRIIYDCLE